MKKLIFTASFVSALLVAGFADAQGRFDNNRGMNQNYRIQKGVRHGQITGFEARQLRIQQEKVARLKRMAMRDGIITPRERMMIRQAEKEMSYAIHQQRNDRDFRW